MNDDKTTKEQADKLAADLNAAGAKLEAAEIPAPTIPEDAKATVMGLQVQKQLFHGRNFQGQSLIKYML